jgi:hypothetical protein
LVASIIHKDLHAAAVVDEQDRVLATVSFAATRQVYRQMLAWMRSFGTLQRVALQMIHNTIVCAPDNLREALRQMTRMQLIRTLVARRPDLTAYSDVEAACRIGLSPWRNAIWNCATRSQISMP